jgi:hypothetical protein
MQIENVRATPSDALNKSFIMKKFRLFINSINSTILDFPLKSVIQVYYEKLLTWMMDILVIFNLIKDGIVEFIQPAQKRNLSKSASITLMETSNIIKQ